MVPTAANIWKLFVTRSSTPQYFSQRAKLHFTGVCWQKMVFVIGRALHRFSAHMISSYLFFWSIDRPVQIVTEKDCKLQITELSLGAFHEWHKLVSP